MRADNVALNESVSRRRRMLRASAISQTSIPRSRHESWAAPLVRNRSAKTKEQAE